MLSKFKKLSFKSFANKNYKQDYANDNILNKAFEKHISFDQIRTCDVEAPVRLINKRIDELNNSNKTHRDIMIDSNLPKSTFNRIISDFPLNNLPKKENLIKLSVGLELNLSQTLKLLNLYGYTLSNSSKLDVTCKFFFTNWKYLKEERGTGQGITELQFLLSKWSTIEIMERQAN